MAINFVKRQGRQGGCRNEADVSITATARGRSRKVDYKVSFSMNSAMIAFCGEPFGSAGYDEDRPYRIYFCKSEKDSGYKIAATSSSGKRKYFVPAGLYSIIEKANKVAPDAFCGQYRLEFDNKLDLCFIDLQHKTQ